MLLLQTVSLEVDVVGMAYIAGSLAHCDPKLLLHPLQRDGEREDHD